MGKKGRDMKWWGWQEQGCDLSDSGSTRTESEFEDGDERRRNVFIVEHEQKRALFKISSGTNAPQSLRRYDSTQHTRLTTALKPDSESYKKMRQVVPIGTYPTYVQMSTLHMNELRMAEIRGERGVARTCTVTRKFSDKPSTMTIKTPVPHRWRNEILTEFRCQRAGPSGLDTSLQPAQPTSEEAMET
ncbi:unnamed protein product [Cylicocyclus nassatus]|uniref:Uncharacterized protein n=1 Tax=Cylicocyclus nassatus TaxID=53992 RepID=A0AA36M8N9_CYLNA|nr:unnamed protein product [Cylicocyclus nassatus]